MTVKIPLRLRGIDLRDADAYGRIDPELTNLFWEANGAVSLAVVYSDEAPSDASHEAVDWARRIAKLMPGVDVAEVHDELVSVPDIAARAGVGPEAVRLWAAGKRRASVRPFPVPRQVVGSESARKSMNLYAWREVVPWIREVLGIDPDEGIQYLNDVQCAHVNAELADIAADPAWHVFRFESCRRATDTQHTREQGVVGIGDATSRVCGNEITSDGYRIISRATC